MKEWIKKLTGEEMAEIYSWGHLWDDVDTTKEFDQKIFKMIDEYDAKRRQKKKKPVRNKFLLAAIIAILLLIPVLFIINNLQSKDNLFLAKTENHVIFRIQNKAIQLKPGDSINENTLIQTDANSTCQIKYGKKAEINMYEKSELEVSEYDENRISFVLAAGKLHISETMAKDIRISFYTKNAYIYAIGTIYSVEYDKSNNETTVKTFEGTVHIETIPQKEVIDLKAGEEIIITNAQILCNQSESLVGEKEWKIKTVYYNPNIKEPVIGFDVFQEYITVTTEHSVICFTREENQWEDSIKDAIISPPTIFNERVYISTKDTIFCYNLYSGIREKDINLIEKMGVGKKLVKYDDHLYFVFPSGIYLFDSINQDIQRKPFIYIIDATLPVFFNNQIFVTSYITRNAEAYDLTGELLWSISLNDWSPFSPVLIEDYLYIVTKKNTLYKITLSGEIEKQKQIEGTIESILSDNERFLYVNTKRNRLFKVDNQTLNNTGFYDNIETAFSHNNTLFLGKRDGIIKIIARNTEKEIILRNSFATVFTNHETDYYAGLNNGYILRINEE